MIQDRVDIEIETQDIKNFNNIIQEYHCMKSLRQADNPARIDRIYIKNGYIAFYNNEVGFVVFNYNDFTSKMQEVEYD